MAHLKGEWGIKRQISRRHRSSERKVGSGRTYDCPKRQEKYHILDVEKNKIDEKKRVIHKRRKRKVIKLITIQNHKKWQFFSKKVDNVNKIVEN